MSGYQDFLRPDELYGLFACEAGCILGESGDRVDEALARATVLQRAKKVSKCRRADGAAMSFALDCNWRVCVGYQDVDAFVSGPANAADSVTMGLKEVFHFELELGA